MLADLLDQISQDAQLKALREHIEAWQRWTQTEEEQLARIHSQYDSFQSVLVESTDALRYSVQNLKKRVDDLKSGRTRHGEERVVDPFVKQILDKLLKILEGVDHNALLISTLNEVSRSIDKQLDQYIQTQIVRLRDMFTDNGSIITDFEEAYTSFTQKVLDIQERLQSLRDESKPLAESVLFQMDVEDPASSSHTRQYDDIITDMAEARRSFRIAMDRLKQQAVADIKSRMDKIYTRVEMVGENFRLETVGLLGEIDRLKDHIDTFRKTLVDTERQTEKKVEGLLHQYRQAEEEERRLHEQELRESEPPPMSETERYEKLFPEVGDPEFSTKLKRALEPEDYRMDLPKPGDPMRCDINSSGAIDPAPYQLLIGRLSDPRIRKIPRLLKMDGAGSGKSIAGWCCIWYWYKLMLESMRSTRPFMKASQCYVLVWVPNWTAASGWLVGGDRTKPPEYPEEKIRPSSVMRYSHDDPKNYELCKELFLLFPDGLEMPNPHGAPLRGMKVLIQPFSEPMSERYVALFRKDYTSNGVPLWNDYLRKPMTHNYLYTNYADSTHYPSLASRPDLVRKLHDQQTEGRNAMLDGKRVCPPRDGLMLVDEFHELISPIVADYHKFGYARQNLMAFLLEPSGKRICFTGTPGNTLVERVLIRNALIAPDKPLAHHPGIRFHVTELNREAHALAAADEESRLQKIYFNENGRWKPGMEDQWMAESIGLFSYVSAQHDPTRMARVESSKPAWLKPNSFETLPGESLAQPDSAPRPELQLVYQADPSRKTAGKFVRTPKSLIQRYRADEEKALRDSDLGHIRPIEIFVPLEESRWEWLKEKRREDMKSEIQPNHQDALCRVDLSGADSSLQALCTEVVNDSKRKFSVRKDVGLFAQGHTATIRTIGPKCLALRAFLDLPAMRNRCIFFSTTNLQSSWQSSHARALKVAMEHSFEASPSYPDDPSQSGSPPYEFFTLESMWKFIHENDLPLTKTTKIVDRWYETKLPMRRAAYFGRLNESEYVTKAIFSKVNANRNELIAALLAICVDPRNDSKHVQVALGDQTTSTGFSLGTFPVCINGNVDNVLQTEQTRARVRRLCGFSTVEADTTKWVVEYYQFVSVPPFWKPVDQNLSLQQLKEKAPHDHSSDPMLRNNFLPLTPDQIQSRRMGYSPSDLAFHAWQRVAIDYPFFAAYNRFSMDECKSCGVIEPFEQASSARDHRDTNMLCYAFQPDRSDEVEVLTGNERIMAMGRLMGKTGEHIRTVQDACSVMKGFSVSMADNDLYSIREATLLAYIEMFETMRHSEPRVSDHAPVRNPRPHTRSRYEGALKNPREQPYTYTYTPSAPSSSSSSNTHQEAEDWEKEPDFTSLASTPPSASQASWRNMWDSTTAFLKSWIPAAPVFAMSEVQERDRPDTQVRSRFDDASQLAGYALLSDTWALDDVAAVARLLRKLDSVRFSILKKMLEVRRKAASEENPKRAATLAKEAAAHVKKAQYMFQAIEALDRPILPPEFRSAKGQIERNIAAFEEIRMREEKLRRSNRYAVDLIHRENKFETLSDSLGQVFDALR